MTSGLINTIRGLACEVYTILGGGYNESVYEQALAVEMRQAGIAYQRQSTQEVIYKGEHVGDHALDFLVEDELVVKLKSAGSITKTHVGQLRAYLRTTGFKQGILLNFPYPPQPEPQLEEVTVEEENAE